MKNTFKKEERLCSRSAIDVLFHNGSSFVVYPFRVVHSFSKAETFEVKVILSVSKRIFKRAHDRNRIKRLMREAYRLNKSKFFYSSLEANSIKMHFAIQYIAKQELPLVILNEKMDKVLSQLNRLSNA